jgi:hypothetical protein
MQAFVQLLDQAWAEHRFRRLGDVQLGGQDGGGHGSIIYQAIYSAGNSAQPGEEGLEWGGIHHCQLEATERYES